MPLAPGGAAPDFTLPDAEGQLITLSQFLGETVVLYFYPRDNTPGCTQEACGFRDAYPTYLQRRIHVLGVSADTAASHRKFSGKLQLPFPLLVDEGGVVATAYGVYGPKKFMGKEFIGITRTTFVIDPKGQIAQVTTRVKVASHAQDLLIQIP